MGYRRIGNFSIAMKIRRLLKGDRQRGTKGIVMEVITAVVKKLLTTAG